MRMLSMLLVLAILSGQASAAPPKEDAIGYMTYRSTNLLTHKEADSRWAISFIEGGTVKVKRKMPLSQIDETVTYGVERITRFEALGIYQKEVLFSYEGQVKFGDGNIGHLETWDIKTNTLLVAYPLVFRMEDMGATIRGEFTVFLDQGRILSITRDFKSDEEYAPLRERHTTRNVLGGIEDDIVFTRQVNKGGK